jgi:hypothetical protein
MVGLVDVSLMKAVKFELNIGFEVFSCQLAIGFIFTVSASPLYLFLRVQTSKLPIYN